MLLTDMATTTLIQIGGFFVMANDRIKTRRWYFSTPGAIFKVDDLTIYEQMIYMVLQFHANSQSSAYPSYKTLADEGRMSRRKAIDAVAALVKKGLLTKEEQFTDGSEIENKSNLYIIEDAYDFIEAAPPSAQHAPPLVHSMHHPSAHRAPELNHLTLPSINMIDCMSASAETAAASEPFISESEGNEIYQALTEHVPANCYVQGIPLGQEYIAEIYLMLINQFSNMLDAEVIRMAAELYFERACKIVPGTGVVMKLDVQNPTGLFHDCYRDAWKLSKLKQRRREG
jgi:hypothetical protein